MFSDIWNSVSAVGTQPLVKIFFLWNGQMADVTPTRSITSAADVPTGNLVVWGDKSVEREMISEIPRRSREEEEEKESRWHGPQILRAINHKQ